MHTGNVFRISTQLRYFWHIEDLTFVCHTTCYIFAKYVLIVEGGFEYSLVWIFSSGQSLIDTHLEWALMGSVYSVLRLSIR